MAIRLKKNIFGAGLVLPLPIPTMDPLISKRMDLDIFF
jgi:hypothetical protein